MFRNGVICYCSFVPSLQPFNSLDATDPRSLADLAHERIREAIVLGTLQPGARLSERGLAAALNISAQPVRDALRRLETEGLVETQPRSGTYVADLSATRLTEIGLIRSALEGVAAALAATRIDAAGCSALRSRLAAVRRATKQEDAEAVAAANDALHAAIHAAAGSGDLRRLLERLRAYDYLGRARVLSSPAERQRAVEEHHAIVAAIEAGAARKAEAIMRDHALRSLAVAFPEEAAAAIWQAEATEGPPGR
ncbi:GntR family transcriptional regulator [Teichococcus coralli]|uniref:GntR family transcriptional regulator n=1 Tax=Teichococcus coralli TaxID=2545983 RepID=UPI001F2D3F60|nr:GntR family transcriptional regulator [Pseudoroseomonas coralli]